MSVGSQVPSHAGPETPARVTTACSAGLRIMFAEPESGSDAARWSTPPEPVHTSADATASVLRSASVSWSRSSSSGIDLVSPLPNVCRTSSGDPRSRSTSRFASRDRRARTGTYTSAVTAAAIIEKTSSVVCRELGTWPMPTTTTRKTRSTMPTRPASQIVRSSSRAPQRLSLPRGADAARGRPASAMSLGPQNHRRPSARRSPAGERGDDVRDQEGRRHDEQRDPDRSHDLGHHAKILGEDVVRKAAGAEPERQADQHAYRRHGGRLPRHRGHDLRPREAERLHYREVTTPPPNRG